jgi:hypothetical protein
MTTHDVLAYAVATFAVKQLRDGAQGWAGVLSSSVHVTSSRAWPVPDFVILDEQNRLSVAAEFKPPRQTKREYLTGLGQAVAYTRDFSHGALVLPTTADDGYRISDHVVDVLGQDLYERAPVAVWTYDPALLSGSDGRVQIGRALRPRDTAVPSPVTLSESFYAKWREASPMEIALYLDYLYEAMRESSEESVRDRAFARLWIDMLAGRTTHWAGSPRNISDTPRNREGQKKNYRNFLSHIGWTTGDGSLTETGLDALHVSRIYGGTSEVFLDHLSVAVLLAGKHLVLLNAISTFQDSHGAFDVEGVWLDCLEDYLETEGLLKRNPGRRQAATAATARGFLKAEKQLWRNLRLIVPRGNYVFHPGRGFIFDWERITSLLAR